MTSMNRLLKLLCAVLVLCGLLCCAGAAGAEDDCAHAFADGACTTCGVTGGYCGASTNEGGEQSVVWTLKDNHLVISGTGAMADYSFYEDLPWWDAYTTITDVTIGEGVTCISDYAFYCFQSLTEITIPASVESIGYEAFRGSGVSSVTFAPNSRLTTIDDYAFSCVDFLKHITLPASVETIGNSAFESCYALETVTFAEGSRLSSLGYMPFFDCNSLTAISIPESATACKTIDGVLYSGDGTTLLLYPAGKTDEAFTTPAGVTTIAESAMNYAQFRTVTLSEGVTTIGNGAFFACSGMQSVSLPSTLTSIGAHAFADCNALTTVTIPASVSSIGMEAFASCYGLTEVTIPASVTSIGSNAFDSCYDLTTVNVPCSWDGSLYTFADTVTVVVADHDFVDGKCTGCGADCAHPGYADGVCTQCGGICAHTFEDGACTTCGLAGGTCGAEGDGSNLTWTLKDGVLTISGTGAMADYDGEDYGPWHDALDPITAVTIGNGVTHIGTWAFADIGAETITFAANSQLTTIGYHAFCGSSLREITIPASVETIGFWAFQFCSQLSTVTFAEGSRITSIGSRCFGDCSVLNAIIVPEDNTAYKTIDGVLYSGDGTTLIRYPAAKSGESFTIPAGVTAIGKNAFDVARAIRYLTLSEGVTTIDSYAFNFCTNLTEVTIPASVTSIGSSAFRSCRELTTVNAPCSWDGSLYSFEDTVTVVVADHAFVDGVCTACGVTGGYCGAATNAGGEQSVVWTYRDGTLSITGTGDMADYESELNMPWSSYDSSVTTLHIGEGVTRIGSCAFWGFSSVSELTIPASVTSIGESALYHFGGTSITFAADSRLTTIEPYVFSFMDSLKQITLPASVETLGDRAFDGCEALESVTFAEGSRLSSLGNDTFYACYSLTAINIPESVTAYRTVDGVLYSGDGTTLLYYPQGKTDESFTTPAGVTTIAKNAFLFTQVSSVTLSEGVTTIEAHAFDTCVFTSVSLPDTLTTIGEYAFADCSLTGITIPAGVKSIGKDAFIYCDALTTVNAPCNWDGSLFTFADTVTVNVGEHTGGKANCQSGAICGTCGEAYGELDYDVHAKTGVVWEWRSDDEYVYAYATLTCSDCGDELAVTSGEGEFLGETEGTDCQNPGSASYSATLTFEDGTEVSGTHTVAIPSENHVGPMNNGFCAACGGLETPQVDPGEYEDETWDDVYLISNAGQLYWFANEVNNNSNDIGGRLTANITVPASVSKGGSIPDWTPIGQGWTPYCGAFNGQGHTISGLYCEASRAGLFGYTDYNYNIRNVGVVNGTFIGSDYAGALAGYASSEISGCWASGNTVEGNYAGGLVGCNYGNIAASRGTNNTVKGNLAGGLVGFNNYGTVERSYGAGNTVTGESAGGLVGENYGNIENSYSTGNSTGYLVGYNGDPITNCFTDGSALFRDSYGDVTNSYYVASAANDEGGRTAAQFASGEIAWLLQSAIEPEEVWDEETGEWVMADAPLVWGQAIGSASFPTLSGQRVYQVLSCDGEGQAYANTDEPQQHKITDGICVNCGAEVECPHGAWTDGVCGSCGAICPHDTGNGNACSICGMTVNRVMMTLPSSLTTIGAEAFTGTAAEAVVIPADCTSIAADAFAACASLKVIIFTEADCTIATGAIPSGVIILAPAGGTVEAWATANELTFMAR